MSHWKALAAVRDVPEAELRERLIEATEALIAIGEALDVERDPRAQLSAFEADALEAIDELQTKAEDAVEEAERADGDRREAEERLEQRLQDEAVSGDTALVARALAAEKERDDALKQVDVMKASADLLIETYSDALSAARKFISKCEGSAATVRHVRPARKPRKAARS